MTTKKNNPSKTPSGSGAQSGPKKPYATLNLKATEVKSYKGESAKTGAAAKAESSPAVAAQTDAPKGASSSDKNAAASSKPTAASATSSRPKAAAGKAPPAPVAKSKPKPGSRILGTLSHMTAGALGGFLALWGADSIMPKLSQFGIPMPTANTDTIKATAALEQRLSTLEAARANTNVSDNGALEAQVNAADAKLAELEALAATVATLRERQDTLVTQMANAQSQAPSGDKVGALDSRLNELEKQLTTIESTAGQGKGGNGLANIAVISGRLVDLETTLQNQMTALRSSVGNDIETRIASISETSEAAKSGTQRMDAQLATITTDTARLSQRLEVLKADTVRLTETAQVAREETGAVKSALQSFQQGMKKTVAGLATHTDVDTAVTAVATQIDSLEHNVGQVVQSEKDRKTNAKRIVLSLEIGNLKRTLDRGEPYEAELAQVQKTSDGTLDLSKLEAFEATGVPTLATLESSFRPVANSILDAARTPTEGTVFEQLLAGARSVVRVRKVNLSPDDTSVEAVVGRMETALKTGQLDEVVKASQGLSEKVQLPAKDWLEKVEARRSVAVALSQIDEQLKASLSGPKAGLAPKHAPTPTQAN